MAELPTGTVTLLFTDIEGSTRLLRRAGDAYAGLLSQHRSLLTQAFLAHRGVVVDQEGDAFFVAFASAKDAVAAAADAQRALVSHDWVDENEIRVRIGLHTGEPRVVEGRYVGLDVHLAARVMAAAHGGQVVVSETTQGLLDEDTRLRDLGEHRLKDIVTPQRLYQLELEGLPSEFPPLATLDNRPTNLPAQPNAFIGRERELAETRALLEREDVRLLTLIGPGGTGKTRLALQLAWDVLEQFRNGVFFVSLAPIRDWELVVPTVLRTLGLREQPGENAARDADRIPQREGAAARARQLRARVCGCAGGGRAARGRAGPRMCSSRAGCPCACRPSTRIASRSSPCPTCGGLRSPRRSWTSSRFGCSSSGRAPRPPTSPSAT